VRDALATGISGLLPRLREDDAYKHIAWLHRRMA
jgi:hypothetical protein